MKTATAHLEGVSPLSWGKFVRVEKLEDETPAQYEERNWRHQDADGNCFIPPMALKKSLQTAAKNYSKKIPGKGQATYTKHFTAGVLCPKPAMLGVHADELRGNWLQVPSDGKPGGGSRVEKCFPEISSWSTEATFLVLDGIITPAIFEEYLEKAGQFVGIGFFRPERGGFYGRFKVNKVSWA
jgi:hypothetical protein